MQFIEQFIEKSINYFELNDHIIKKRNRNIQYLC